MNIEKLLISFGLSSLFITIIDFYHTSTFEFGGIIGALFFIGAGFNKLKKSNSISLGYVLGYLSATSINSIVLGMVLAAYSSPFLVADSVTVALDEVMTLNHWLAFIIGLILILKGVFSSKKN